MKFPIDPSTSGRLKIFTLLSFPLIAGSLLVLRIDPQSMWADSLFVSGFFVFLGGIAWVAAQPAGRWEHRLTALVCMAAGFAYGFSFLPLTNLLALHMGQAGGRYEQGFAMALLSAMYAGFTYGMSRNVFDTLRAPKPTILAPLRTRLTFAISFVLVGLGAISWWGISGEAQFQDYLATAEWAVSLKAKLTA